MRGGWRAGKRDPRQRATQGQRPSAAEVQQQGGDQEAGEEGVTALPGNLSKEKNSLNVRVERETRVFLQLWDKIIEKVKN
jgi:hypothetical protein